MNPNRLGTCVAVDTETTGLSRWHGDKLFAISACDSDGNTAYAQWKVCPFTRVPIYDPADMKRWAEFLGSSRTFIYFNGKFDRHMLEEAGFDVSGQHWHDALLALKCVDSGLYSYRLKPVCASMLDFPNDDEKDLLSAVYAARRLGKKRGWKLAEEAKADMHLAPAALVRRYGVQDAERTMLLWLSMQDALKEVMPVYVREMAIQPWLARMETRGVMINPERLASATAQLAGREAVAKATLDSFAWDGFNPNSAPQVCRLLFDDLNLPVEKRGKASKQFPDGQPKTGRTFIERLDHPVIDALMEYRRISKLHQFCVQWADLAVDNVIHTNINAAEAVTGRMSTNTPNLQQVPKRDPELAKLVRAIFGPRPGYVWLCADYSQMELRMLAGLAEETSMVEAFAAGRDIHEETMMRIFPESMWKAAPDKCRTMAKNTNFGILYGIGPEKLARELRISHADAAALISRFKQAFPRVTNFMNESVKLARSRGMVENPYGRRMTVPREEPYKATNYRVQGSGADVIKEAIPKIGEMFDRYNLDAHMILPVHDELVNEIRQSQCRKWVARGLKRRMEDHGGRFTLPLPVDVDLVTDNWSEKDGDWATAA